MPCRATPVIAAPAAKRRSAFLRTAPAPTGSTAPSPSRKTHLVSLSLAGAQQCARDALLEMLGDEYEEAFETFSLTGLHEGEHVPAWLHGIVRDFDDVRFYTWTEQSAGGVEQPTAYVVTVRAARLACATKAQLRGGCDEASLVGRTQSQLHV